MKTNKSYSKRLRVTRNGKIVARKGGQDHFNARAHRKLRTKKGQVQFITMKPGDRARFLPGS
jgi:ribosomal protein L35